MIEMKKMIAEAKRHKLWLFASYQSLWFSPEQLESAQANGRFQWGPVNWKLRDPQERLEELVMEADQAIQRVSDFQKVLAARAVDNDAATRQQ